jgi:hypothetical protein
VNEAKDKTGRTIKIKHDPSLAGSRAYSFFLRQYAQSIDAGNTMKRANWVEERCGIIYAEYENTVVGMIVYQRNERGLFLVMSGVDTAERNRGIFSILNTHFENTAREFNKEFIFSVVNVNNYVRLKTAERTGFRPISRLFTRVL